MKHLACAEKQMDSLVYCMEYNKQNSNNKELKTKLINAEICCDL